MPVSTCTHCGADHAWTWDEAFLKFGFGDGDGLVMTETVADRLIEAGYDIEHHVWGCHNDVISSIRDWQGHELIPREDIEFGYDEPRSYLPADLIALLDAAFPSAEDGGAR